MTAETPAATAAAFRLTSEAFAPGASVPALYTCDGEDRSPPLAWSGAPERTRTFTLILDDPDAPRGEFTHWVLANLPAAVGTLPAGVPRDAVLPNGAVQGRNDFGGRGYGGPCPPAGPAHRYRFTLYAVNGGLDLAPEPSKPQALEALRERVVGRAELVGTYQRSAR